MVNKTSSQLSVCLFQTDTKHVLLGFT